MKMLLCLWSSFDCWICHFDMFDECHGFCYLWSLSSFFPIQENVFLFGIFQMGPSVHRRSPTRRYSSDELDSPVKARRSPRRTNYSHREVSPPRRRGSPRTSSPGKTYPSRKTRSPAGNLKISSRSRSPDRRQFKASASRSPSPRSKRLRRTLVEKDLEKERRRSGGREDDKGRHRDYEAVAEGLHERRKEKNHDKVFRSQHKRSTSPSKRERINNHSSRSGHDESTSPRQGSRNHRSRHDRSTSPRDSKARENIEVSGDIPWFSWLLNIKIGNHTLLSDLLI